MTISSQLIGNACGHHGPCTFYKTLGIAGKNGQKESISVGQFFFLRFGATEPVCVGELQLLWKDKNINSTLSSCRLYYLPENTPEGRHGHHGEDEVLAVSEKVVLRVEDLAKWIVSDVQWERGLKGCFAGEEQSSDQALRNTDSDTSCQSTDSCERVVKTEQSSEPTSLGLVETFIANNLGSSTKACLLEEQQLHRPRKECEGSTVKILSYASYCRYRGVLKRLENVTDTWLRNALVVALGGFTVPSPNCRLHFCRETFDYPLLDGHALLLNHLAPSLRGRPRKKRSSTKLSSSLSSESNENESEEWGDISVKESKLTNGIKELAGEDLEEQEFLQSLFKFMRQRNTPIERVPHLGFKQINLYFFYTYTQKLGGYDKITIKKMWKHIYDELGGNPGSTSAATCTRRHYERLLLPFERYLKGEDMPHSRLPVTKESNSTSSNATPLLSSPTLASSNSVNPNSPTSDPCSSQPTEMEPLRISCSRKKSIEEDVLPASPSPDSPPLLLAPSPPHLVAQETSTVCSSVITPLPSTVLLVPSKPGQPEEVDVEDRKPVMHMSSACINFALEQGPLQYLHNQQRKRAKDERFAEKERMWDEIRRQNAVERDRIRQLTAAARSVSSRGIKAKDMLLEPPPSHMPMLNPRPHLRVSNNQAVVKPPLQHSQPPLNFHAATPKRKKLEQDEGHVRSFALHSKGLPARVLDLCPRKQDVPSSWRPSSSATMLRPSVIQHTHSAVIQPPQYKILDPSPLAPSESKPQERHGSGLARNHFSPSVPAAHSYSPIQYHPCSADASKETVTTKDTGLCLRRPCQQDVDSSRSVSQPAEEDSVLDLRVKKNVSNWQNGHSLPLERRPGQGPDEEHRRYVTVDGMPRDSNPLPEDLSAKAEPKCHPVQDRALSNIATVFPLPGGRDLTHHVMPSQYIITSDKTPVFFPDYGPLLPPHYFGVSFPMSYPSFAFSSNLCPTAYKEPSPYLFLPKGT